MLSIVAHVSPRATAIVHIYDISLHFRERRIVADDSLWLNAAKHLPVACQKPLFLFFMMLTFRCHIGRHSNGTSFLNSLKAEIEGGFIAPVDGRNNTQTLGCPVSAAPTVAEYIVKLHDRCHFQIHTEIRRQQKQSPDFWSECRDSNPRPLGPEPSAIPNFATPR